MKVKAKIISIIAIVMVLMSFSTGTVFASTDVNLLNHNFHKIEASSLLPKNQSRLHQNEGVKKKSKKKKKKKIVRKFNADLIKLNQCDASYEGSIKCTITSMAMVARAKRYLNKQPYEHISVDYASDGNWIPGVGFTYATNIDGLTFNVEYGGAALAEQVIAAHPEGIVLYKTNDHAIYANKVKGEWIFIDPWEAKVSYSIYDMWSVRWENIDTIIYLNN